MPLSPYIQTRERSMCVWFNCTRVKISIIILKTSFSPLSSLCQLVVCRRAVKGIICARLRGGRTLYEGRSRPYHSLTKHLRVDNDVVIKYQVISG